MNEPLSAMGESLQLQIKAIKLKQTALFLTLDIIIGLLSEVMVAQKLTVNPSASKKYDGLILSLETLDKEIADIAERN